MEEGVRGLSIEEFLRDLGIAVVGGIIAGLLSPLVVFLARQRHREREEECILGAFVNLSGGRLDMPVAEREAAEEANIHDYVPLVERLWRRGELRDIPGRPGYYALTLEGRERGSERPWWRFWR